MRFKGLSRHVRHNIILALLSALLTLVFIEAGVHVFINPGEMPYVRSHETFGITRTPGMSGRWLDLNDGIATHYRINNLGFNDTRDRTAARSATLRIAVIGDSFVEAFQVEPDQAFPALLEASLSGASGGRAGETSINPACRGGVEVLRFGVGGAALSQYEHELPSILSTYQPDVVIVNLVTNDYHESLVEMAPLPYFWTWARAADGSFFPVKPPVFVPNETERLRQHLFATRRLVVLLRERGALTALPWTRPYFALDEASERQNRDIAALTDLLIGRMADTAREHGATLVLVSEFGRAQVYGEPVSGTEAHWRDVVFDSAGRHDVPMIDLIPALTADYAQHGERFEFLYDLHWNVHGHQVVADAVEAWLRANVCE